MKIRPLNAYILVKPEEKTEEVTKSGFVVNVDTDDNADIRMICEVIEVGGGIVLPNGKRTQFDVEPGDKVLIKSYAGDRYQDHLFILQSDILAKVD